MKSFAIVEIAGHQYQVSPDQELEVNKLDSKKGSKISFKKVLLIVNGKTKIGSPYIEGASVKAEIINHFKGEKIRVATYKAKSRYRRVKGFRSYLTHLKILEINN